MKYLKLFENTNNKYKYQDGRFIEPGVISDSYHTFIWNLDKKTNLAEFIQFRRSKIYLNKIKIETIYKSRWDMDVILPEKNFSDLVFLTPKEYFKRNEKLCIDLFYEIQEKLNNKHLSEFRRIKLNKLFEALKNIEELQLLIKTKRFNL